MARSTLHAGSPPRVRSRQTKGHQIYSGIRITSACAEQTYLCGTNGVSIGDHLRVCGADSASHNWASFLRGSPPRVRSRLTVEGGEGSPVGITSACAEQTIRVRSHTEPWWDHLRVCGADAERKAKEEWRKGSPPRVRSRQTGQAEQQDRPRITSACAEQTCPVRRSCRSKGDHLRVCGADMLSTLGATAG